MSDSRKTIIKYFGYGSNADKDMMIHMIGRDDIVGEPGKLIDYQLCIQSLDQIRDMVPPTSPIKDSPRDLIRKNFGDTFDLFVAIPKQGAVTYGTIWDLTPDEIDLVKEWECVEYGMQEEIKATAIDFQGNAIEVETQAVIDPPAQYHTIIDGNDYSRYIVNKNKMLETADKVREDYLEMIKKLNEKTKHTEY